MAIDPGKTLEQLENDYWQEPASNSRLIAACTKLRKKPLQDLTIEDLRLLIGQNIGLAYLIPLAVKKLTGNILAEGDFYEGDLLKSVLDCDRNYWQQNKLQWETVQELYEKNVDLFESDNIYRQIRKSYGHFRNINPECS